MMVKTKAGNPCPRRCLNLYPRLPLAPGMIQNRLASVGAFPPNMLGVGDVA
jgi:hypothetical protein